MNCRAECRAPRLGGVVAAATAAAEVTEERGTSLLPPLPDFNAQPPARQRFSLEYTLHIYGDSEVEKEGIHVLDWPFDDGAPPPNQIVDDWLNLLKTKFREEPGCSVAVRCVAGLGRAPVLVALALIECGMKYEDAVQFVRQKRRGAFNSKQLLYLENYRLRCNYASEIPVGIAVFSRKKCKRRLT
ncbi:hypothetical protein H8959_019478 [Pygathrix nigripes]